MSVVAHPHCSRCSTASSPAITTARSRRSTRTLASRASAAAHPPFNLFTAITNVTPLRGARERANEQEAAEGGGARHVKLLRIRALLDLDVDSDGEDDNPDNPGRSASQRSTQTEPQRQETGAATARIDGAAAARRQAAGAAAAPSTLLLLGTEGQVRGAYGVGDALRVTAHVRAARVAVGGEDVDVAPRRSAPSRWRKRSFGRGRSAACSRRRSRW